MALPIGAAASAPRALGRTAGSAPYSMSGALHPRASAGHSPRWLLRSADRRRTSMPPRHHNQAIAALSNYAEPRNESASQGAQRR